MKNIIRLLACLITTLIVTSCVPRSVSQMGGYEDHGFIVFVSNGKHHNKEVEVTIDQAAPYTAQAVKAADANRKGKAYQVKSGQHRVTVKFENQIIAIKDILISSQETQLIQLP